MGLHSNMPLDYLYASFDHTIIKQSYVVPHQVKALYNNTPNINVWILIQTQYIMFENAIFVSTVNICDPTIFWKWMA